MDWHDHLGVFYIDEVWTMFFFFMMIDHLGLFYIWPSLYTIFSFGEKSDQSGPIVLSDLCYNVHFDLWNLQFIGINYVF